MRPGRTISWKCHPHESESFHPLFTGEMYKEGSSTDVLPKFRDAFAPEFEFVSMVTVVDKSCQQPLNPPIALVSRKQLFYSACGGFAEEILHNLFQVEVFRIIRNPLNSGYLVLFEIIRNPVKRSPDIRKNKTQKKKEDEKKICIFFTSGT